LEEINNVFDLELPVDFYTNLRLYVDGVKLTTKRGYILGMFNYGFSLISYVIYKMNPVLEPSYKILIGNDDSIISIPKD